MTGRTVPHRVEQDPKPGTGHVPTLLPLMEVVNVMGAVEKQDSAQGVTDVKVKSNSKGKSKICKLVVVMLILLMI